MTTMTKFFLIWLILPFSFLIEAQVGINTTNPQGIFHVDPNRNTVGTANALDDIIVTGDGYMGLGTVTPSTNLHIKTATAGTGTDTPVYGFRLADGSQADRRALVSDANGLARWSGVVPEGGVTAVKSTVGISQPVVNDGIYYNSGTTLTLPRGKWLVQVVMYIVATGTSAAQYNDRMTLSSTFSEINVPQTLAGSGVASVHIEGANYISGTFWKAGSGGILYGTLVINNPLATTTYYYYMGNTIVYGTEDPTAQYLQIGGTKGEDNIVAFRLPENL